MITPRSPGSSSSPVSFTALETRTAALFGSRKLHAHADKNSISITEIGDTTLHLRTDLLIVIHGTDEAHRLVQALLTTARGRFADLEGKLRIWFRRRFLASAPLPGLNVGLHLLYAPDDLRITLADFTMHTGLTAYVPAHWPRLALLDWWSALLSVELEEYTKMLAEGLLEGVHRAVGT